VPSLAEFPELRRREIVPTFRTPRASFKVAEGRQFEVFGDRFLGFLGENLFERKC